MDNIPPHGPASPQSPPGVSWVKLDSGGTKPTENCHQLDPQLQTGFPETELGMGPCTTLGMETGAGLRARMHVERQGAARERSEPQHGHSGTVHPPGTQRSKPEGDPAPAPRVSGQDCADAELEVGWAWAGREEKRPLAAPQREQQRREPVAATSQGLHWSGAETDESEDSGTMGSAGSARPGTRRDRDMPAWGLKAASAASP